MAASNNKHIKVVSFYLQMKYINEEDITPESLERVLKIITVSVMPILIFIINNIGLIQDVMNFLNEYIGL